MNFKRIYELRESNDLLQKDIAEYLNVNQRTYSSWEVGTKIIPLKHINKLCNYYKVTMDYFLGLSNEKNSNIENFQLDKKVIGKNLKTFRENNKLTQRQLAKILNTTSSTICAYEQGKTMILTAFAYQICLKYNLSMDWLCGRK